MLVFMDESGDPGFKVEKGSSPVLVVTMVIFDAPEHASEAQASILDLRRRLGVQPEFKFNKLRDDYRDQFFVRVTPLPFRTRSVVVRKALIYSDRLRTGKETFYKFFVRKMMENDRGALIDAKVVIDGSGDRQFKRTFGSYIRKHIPPECVRKVELKDSVADPLIQLADMCAGAIARSYRTDRADSNRWRSQLQRSRKIEDVWEFR